MASVVLLGAGAASGTLGGEAPTSEEFGGYLSKCLPNWAKYYPNLAKVVKHLRPRSRGATDDSWALDKVWTVIDNRAKLRRVLDLSGWTSPASQTPQRPIQCPNIYGENLGKWDAWDFAGFELRRAVAFVYGDSIAGKIDEAVKTKGSVVKEICRLKPGDCAISFNYDLLDEKVLGKCHPSKWVRAHPWLDIANPGNAIVLCKPHGSLNWLQRVPENGRRVQILPKPMREDEIDYKKGATLQPGIVGPVPFKSEIIVPEIQGSVNSFHELLVAQWSWAMRRISEAQELVIMGYGFPAEDLHARFLFKEAIANRKNQSSIIKVRVYEKNKSSYEQVEKQVRRLFKPKQIEIKYEGEVEANIHQNSENGGVGSHGISRSAR